MNIKNISNLRLITFDVTNTLLNTSVKKHYADISLKHDVSLNPDKLEPSFKKYFKHWCHEHPNYGKDTGIGWESWWKNLIWSVFKDQNIKISDEKIDKISTDLIKYYNTKRCWKLYPGALDILKYLNDRKIIVGVISNFDQRLESILRSTQIREYFSFILTSYDFGKEKPDISIFNEALKISEKFYRHKISPEESLHIGDNIKIDYNGAKNAGWNAYLINHHHEVNPISPMLDYQSFNDLFELKNHFKIILDQT
ncbi:Similar to Reg-2: Rhythmically expressed gene 2 protein (Drosophila melanogaster) [Cotesia congregata]|uniref:Similar to Reg-2: Rhythmically expressed gene 2 protein (Drosophila melanogaster) n=1 Tax=Cotesia congregata TaxID=51543 RepID=A0A8J2H8J2_COTCN|nr:Similar to Reg-2: Rhythmically expressed gene 2 protein (Drosophila melanogaster) [Cotesia congregata]